jgi:hypothetical protein
MITTIVGVPVTNEVVENYLSALVNRFFKILPIREAEDATLPIYIQSLQSEMMGCKVFVEELGNTPEFLSLLSILQFLRDNSDCPVKTVKREVFKAINICGKLKKNYSQEVSL